jgi:hypothetical protein
MQLLLCSFLLPRVTLSLFGLNFLLSTLFSNTLSLCSSLVSETKFHTHTELLPCPAERKLHDGSVPTVQTSGCRPHDKLLSQHFIEGPEETRETAKNSGISVRVLNRAPPEYRFSPLSANPFLDTIFNLLLGPPLWSSGQSSWLLSQRSWFRFPALPNYLRISGPGTGSTQPHEHKLGSP